MKLLMLSPHGRILPVPPLGTTDTGGQVTYVLGLSMALARMGHTVTIVNRSWDGERHRTALARNVELLHVPAGPVGFLPKEEIRGVLPALVDQLQDDYDLTIGHYADGMRAAQLLGDSYVAVPHSLGDWKQQRTGDKPARHRLDDETSAMLDADLVVATSGAQAAWIYRRYDVTRTPIAVIPPGIDSDYLFNRHDPAPMGDQAVLAVGRYAKNKNYRRLVRAAGQAREQVPDLTLHLVMGSDPTATEMAQHEAQAWGAVVVVWERPNDAQLAELYRGATLFAMPSTYEPFGMVACEAMGAGTAALIPEGGGLADMLPEGCAYTCDPFTVESIAEQMVRAFQQPTERRVMALRGQTWVRNFVGWHQVAAAWDHALHQAVRKTWAR